MQETEYINVYGADVYKRQVSGMIIPTPYCLAIIV